jgi:ABC-2 type transport system permease protein
VTTTVTRPGGGQAGLRQAVHSEWTKVRTLRSAAGMLAAMVLCTVGIAVFVGATHSLQPDDTVVGGSLTGAAFAQLLAASFGVLVMSREYATGMIRVTLAATPRRHIVLAAKTLVTAMVTFTAGLVACVLAHQIGGAMLAGEGYAPGRPWPALLGVAACFALTAALGLAVGTTVRHSAGAITAMVAVILVPSLLGPIFGDLQRWVSGASPLAALQKLTQTSDAVPDAVGTLSAWPSLGLVAAYTGAALVAAAALFRGRDA